jgi:hypothetical protein
VIEERNMPVSPPQWFVKFTGTAKDRASRSWAIREAGEHYRHACFYSRRPSGVKDGAVMFLSRLVQEPNDILIFGRAIAQAHVPGRDETTAEEILEKDWKRHWRFKILLRDVALMGGTLSLGVSLGALMDELGAGSFRSTSKNAARGHGNIDPRGAYRRQPHVALSPRAAAWRGERLDQRMRSHGRLTEADLVRY